MKYEVAGFILYSIYSSCKPLTRTGDGFVVVFISLGIFCFILHFKILEKSQVSQSYPPWVRKHFLGLIFSLPSFIGNLVVQKEGSQTNMRLYLQLFGFFFYYNPSYLSSDGYVPIIPVSLRSSHYHISVTDISFWKLQDLNYIQCSYIKKKKSADSSNGIKHFWYCSPDHSLFNLKSPLLKDFTD